jgi:hypothetical protein
MKPILIRSLGLALILGANALAQQTDASAPPPDAAPAAPAKTTRTAGYPFRGKLKAVSNDARSFTLAGKDRDRVFHVTPDTKFVRNGKVATLAEGVVGEDVAGYARTESGGRAQALTVRFGPAPVPDPQKTPTRKAPKSSPASE